ncbi:hypothetical protein PL81_21465 [Streptomyces sp. RSD-27]|nr:hypothetical protein PL81_21465 [Streptomyces sp. RSD-27]
MASRQSSWTADSTQPPEREPSAVPPASTAREAPGPRGGVEHRAEDGPDGVLAAHRGDQHVQDPAAGQPHREGVVVAVAEAVDAAASRGDGVQAELVDGGLHAAPGEGAERGAAGVHGQGGARPPRRAATDGDHGGQRELAALGAPAAQRSGDVEHQRMYARRADWPGIRGRGGRTAGGRPVACPPG